MNQTELVVDLPLNPELEGGGESSASSEIRKESEIVMLESQVVDGCLSAQVRCLKEAQQQRPLLPTTGHRPSGGIVSYSCCLYL